MHIELRARTEAHVRIYFEKTRDQEIQAMLPQTAQTMEQAVVDFEKTLLPGATSYGRTIYADGEYVGDIWCYCIDTGEVPNAMLSYCLFEKTLWGKGVTTQALRLFLAEIVPHFCLESVGAFTYAANRPSIAVLINNGFTEVEEFEDNGVRSKYFQRNVEEALCLKYS